MDAYKKNNILYNKMEANKKYKLIKCIVCNKDITATNWSHHVKTRKHIKNSGENVATVEKRSAVKNNRSRLDRECNICNKTISYKNWSHHLQTKKHNAPFEERITVKALRERAKELGLRRFSAMRKKQLLDLTNTTEELNKFNTSFSDDLFEEKPKYTIVEIETALASRLKTYFINNREKTVNVSTFLENIEQLILDKIREQQKHMDLKVNLVLLADYSRGMGKNVEYMEKNFKTENAVILKTTDLEEFYSTASQKMLREMDEFYARGSNWALKRIKGLELRINKYVPLRGSAYMKLPEFIKRKKAIINVKNTDDKCFLWSILSALHPIKNNAELTSSYKQYIHQFDEALKGFEFPFELKNIPKFEVKSGVSINIYSYDEEKRCIYPLHITKNKTNQHVNLFYMSDETESHYCWIKNLSALVRRQITKDCRKIYVCDRCLQKCSSEERLAKHEENCKKFDAVNINLPGKDKNFVKFQDYNNSLRVPFVIYADFECILEREQNDIYEAAYRLGIDPIAKNLDTLVDEIKEKSGVNYKMDESKPYTIKYQKHTPVGFSYYVKCAIDGGYNNLFDYVGLDAA